MYAGQHHFTLRLTFISSSPLAVNSGTCFLGPTEPPCIHIVDHAIGHQTDDQVYIRKEHCGRKRRERCPYYGVVHYIKNLSLQDDLYNAKTFQRERFTKSPKVTELPFLCPPSHTNLIAVLVPDSMPLRCGTGQHIGPGKICPGIHCRR